MCLRLAYHFSWQRLRLLVIFVTLFTRAAHVRCVTMQFLFISLEQKPNVLNLLFCSVFLSPRYFHFIFFLLDVPDEKMTLPAQEREILSLVYAESPSFLVHFFYFSWRHECHYFLTYFYFITYEPCWDWNQTPVYSCPSLLSAF